MSNTWYLNANSESEDGLTPDTGYHSFNNLNTSIILNPGDIVSFVDNGIIDDSSVNLLTISNSITLQSYSLKDKATWKSPKEIDVIGASSFNLTGIILVGTTTLAINGSINSATDPTCTSIRIQQCDFSINCNIIVYGVTSASVVNNIFRNTSQPPILFNSNVGSSIPSINGVAVNNNTFYNVNTYCIGLWSFSDVTNFRILNNIFDTALGRLFFTISGNSSNILIDYNLDYNAPEMAYLSNPNYIGTHNLHYTDPWFTDPTNGNFILLSNSPCINWGIDNSADPSVPTVDFIGTSRPQSYHTDLGVYEYIFPVLPPPPFEPPLTVYPLYAPLPVSGDMYTDQLGNQYTFNEASNQWDKYNPLVDITLAKKAPAFYPGYRMQEDDLNIAFCSQGLYYPYNLAYFYSPVNLSYEIDYYIPVSESASKLIPYGNRNRIPEKVTQGVYRANFIVGYDWPTGFYNIVWKYQMSPIGPVQTITNTFQVLNNGYKNIIFYFHYCNEDLPATFIVLLESEDLPGSFNILPNGFDLLGSFEIN